MELTLRRKIDEWLGKIADCNQRKKKATKKLEDQLAALETQVGELRKKLAEKSEPFDREIAEYYPKVETLAWSHKDELITSQMKTASFPNGELRFRTNPKKVEILNPDLAVQELKEHKLFELICEEPNRSKILSDPEAMDDLQTISIVQNERLEIQPIGCPTITFQEPKQVEV